jgi:RNA polymerase sigma-70 factor, ECF subfamily
MDIAALWSEYTEPVRRFVMKKTNHHHDVEDIVQNVFLKIHSGISDLKDEQRMHSWIFQIARNSIVDHYRKKKQAEELPDDFQTTDEYQEPDYAKEVIACFKSVLPRLPEKYREALELSELKGMPQKQLSGQLGISYSGTKSRVQRGREMLKELLTGCCHIESDQFGNIIDFRIVHDEPPMLRKKRKI